MKIYPAGLYVTTRFSSWVLGGDAFSTSCPAAGTGAGKVFNDVGHCARSTFRAG
jgi:hypothetical protein